MILVFGFGSPEAGEVDVLVVIKSFQDVVVTLRNVLHLRHEFLSLVGSRAGFENPEFIVEFRYLESALMIGEGADAVILGGFQLTHHKDDDGECRTDEENHLTGSTLRKLRQHGCD